MNERTNEWKNEWMKTRQGSQEKKKTIESKVEFWSWTNGFGFLNESHRTGQLAYVLERRTELW